MFEIFMYWVWVSILTGFTFYFSYWVAFHIGHGWSGFLLRKAEYTASEIAVWHTKYKTFVSTPFRLLHFDQTPSGRYDELEPVGLTIFKILFLVLSAIWTVCVVVVSFDRVDANVANDVASGVIYEINRLSVMLAGSTSWAALPVAIFGGGSMAFISIAKLVRKVKPLLDKID